MVFGINVNAITAAWRVDPLPRRDELNAIKAKLSAATTTTSMAARKKVAAAPTKRSINERLRALMGDVLTEAQLEEKFTFGHVLGSGATSKVYAAVDNTTGERVAVKVFDKASMIEVRRSMAADGDYVQEKAVDRVRRRLLKIVSELELCKSLSHPNIIKFLGAYETTHRICIVHELVEGSDLLEHLLKHGKMPEDKAARVFYQLLSALEHCHARHIYHRDLKLENVLLTSDCQVKLIDFGLSEYVAPGKTLKTICGTPLYCSPEVLFLHSSSRNKGFHGAPADVWSVGVLIFALLTGCAPFDDSTLSRLRHDVQRNSIAYPDHISNEVKGMLKAILIFDAHLRPTISDLLQYCWIRSAAEPVKVVSPRRMPLSPNSWVKEARCRTFSACLSDDGTEDTSSTSASYDELPEDLKHTEPAEEPQSPTEQKQTHLSCLERELEDLVFAHA
ncbi:TPA: hypothetical protein N0F65_011059 [Lagenidium giganteum]|uniref:Protein kinase domain-containing protein n=1 Tax=Lagenidium giganteum TaxID=4803 RepID=A0AAV2ZAP8_9STRA|nr:TPA: hypothetical protein N0F65_011059 [Lagenidium giganteum]